LILKGANVNAKDRWGRTPLSDATSGDLKDVIAFLKANGGTQ